MKRFGLVFLAIAAQNKYMLKEAGSWDRVTAASKSLDRLCVLLASESLFSFGAAQTAGLIPDTEAPGGVPPLQPAASRRSRPTGQSHPNTRAGGPYLA